MSTEVFVACRMTPEFCEELGRRFTVHLSHGARCTQRLFRSSYNRAIGTRNSCERFLQCRAAEREHICVQRTVF